MAAQRRLRLSLQHLVRAAASDISSARKVSEPTGGAREDLGDGPVGQSEARPPRAVKKVAIVDDDKDIITIYEFVIKGLGLELEFVAYDGIEIVDAIVKQQVHPDIIIMDHRMHRMNGLEAAMKIRAIDKSIRIILATADDSVIEKAREMGVQTIPKPFSMSKLRELLQGLG
jgi:CheY-like chemotaxis protein